MVSAQKKEKPFILFHIQYFTMKILFFACPILLGIWDQPWY